MIVVPEGDKDLEVARALAIVGWAGAASFWWDKHPEITEPEFLWIAFMEWMETDSAGADTEVAEALRDGIPAWLRDGVVEFLADE